MNLQEIYPSDLPSLPLEDKRSLPCCPCIYFAIDQNGSVQYVGRAVNLKRRWGMHHRFEDLERIGSIRIAYLETDANLLNEVVPTVGKSCLSVMVPP